MRSRVGTLTTTRRKLNEKIKLKEKVNGDKINYHWIILNYDTWYEIYSYKDKSTNLDSVRDFSISGNFDEDAIESKLKLKILLQLLGFEYNVDFSLY